MEHVERFVVVSADKYERINNDLQQCQSENLQLQDKKRQQEISQPSDGPTTLEEVSSNSDPVDNEDKVSPPHVHERHKHKDSQSVKDNDSESEDAMDTSEILYTVPRRFKPKAIKILYMLRLIIKWNHKGEVIKEDGHVLENSKMSDIIRDLVWPFKKRRVIGRDYIAKVLSKKNFPNDVLYQATTAINKMRSEKRESSPDSHKPLKRNKSFNSEFPRSDNVKHWTAI